MRSRKCSAATAAVLASIVVLTPAAGGKWTEKVLYSFCPETGPNGDTHAFLYNPTMSELVDLQLLLPMGGLNSSAYGVNGSGQLVGIGDTSTGAAQVFSL